MKKISFYIIAVIVLKFLISCTSVESDGGVVNVKLIDSTEHLKIDTIKGSLKNLESQLPEFIIKYHNEVLKNEIGKGEYYLFSSKKYVAFKIIEQLNYEARLGWRVFLIKGEVQLSEDDFAEYDFYGVYKYNKVYSYAFLAQPVEIVTELDSYEATDNSISILGRQWDLSGNDDGTNPPQKQDILVVFP